MMITIMELQSETARLVGERFKLFKEIDECKSIYEWPKLQTQLGKLNMQIDQYEKSINGLKEIKGIKRRMMK